MFENSVLGRIFGPKWEKITAGWRKMHYEELHNLYSPPDIIRIISLSRIGGDGHVTRMGKTEKCIQNVSKKCEGMRSHGRPSRRWEGNIKTDLKRIGCDGQDWILVAVTDL
jgi:hypothetical protein